MAKTPDKIGKYRLVRLLRREGKFEFWIAERSDTASTFLAKVPSPEYQQDREISKLLRNEASLAGGLEHEHILKIITCESENGVTCLITENFRGAPLAQVLRDKERQFSGEAIVKLWIKACGALNYVHGKGFTHGNLRPASFWVSDDGDLKLTDFAFASRSSVTRAKFWFKKKGVRGTPGYMSPEQIRADALAPSSDVYALGCVFYEALERRPLFSGTSHEDLLRKHINIRAPKLISEYLPPAVGELLEGMLAKEQEKRPDLLVVRQVLLASLQSEPASNEVPPVLATNDYWQASTTPIRSRSDTDEGQSERWRQDAKTHISNSRIGRFVSKLQAVKFSWAGTGMSAGLALLFMCIAFLVHWINGDFNLWRQYMSVSATASRIRSAHETGNIATRRSLFSKDLEGVQRIVTELLPAKGPLPRELQQLNYAVSAAQQILDSSGSTKTKEENWERLDAHLSSARDALEKRSRSRIADAADMSKVLSEEVVTRHLIALNICMVAGIIGMASRRAYLWRARKKF